MNLNIRNCTFLVTGVTSGFGKATAEHLMAGGAKIIGVARTQSNLNRMTKLHKEKMIPFCGDITEIDNVVKVAKIAMESDISGAFINAGGPPAMQFEETELDDWDNAYHQLLRWKVALTRALLPHFKTKQYGRIVYLESASIKQPIDNLVLSTALRLSVVGMMKTVSQELSGQGITFNMIAPGSHDTPAIDRLIQKQADLQKISFQESKAIFLDKQPSKNMGKPEGAGSLAAWLLSPLSEFVNGQVYAIEGGTIKGTL
ncbi:3-oxoacyl-[acyl-carrier protein] reductase [Saccharicrinis carchari]|uniref:3-oxoacyl-[acyl-carrier protein] reductase n=1 Tax=Saccharicrinis carchari TaxID=1168039 RepID=A0A521DSA8_SACCC|nr:SDR family oxidoreductase [Saccharicrinis carchari]SMO74633.1 3-oxoacyl-[acyl-carrier protein] reductase [Saccharicrinis carchari]